VVIAARNGEKGERAAREIAEETGTPPSYVPLDLSDLDSVVGATAAIGEQWRGRAVDILVENAGLWPRRRGRSAQGHEIAFATNVLGHFVLARRMIDQALLADGARVVVLTGDIYILEEECTPDFEYDGARGGRRAYCRSKLGNLWFTRELQRCHRRLEVCAAHPGVIATGLGGVAGGMGALVKRLLLLDAISGAQTPLICATQPNLERGGYYHNTMGRVVFDEGDPAADAAKAATLWARLHEVAAGYI
jgi:NAD(P)-dependent dehydrogenase (short-subunit alcohol dehydrogenase family)